MPETNEQHTRLEANEQKKQQKAEQKSKEQINLEKIQQEAQEELVKEQGEKGQEIFQKYVNQIIKERREDIKFSKSPTKTLKEEIENKHQDIIKQEKLKIKQEKLKIKQEKLKIKQKTDEGNKNKEIIKEETIKTKEKTIKTKEKTIKTKEKTIKTKEKTIKTKEEKFSNTKKQIIELKKDGIAERDTSKARELINEEKVKKALELYRTETKIEKGGEADLSIEEFYQLTARYLEIQQKVQQGEAISPKETTFVQNFSSLSKTLGIQLPSLLNSSTEELKVKEATTNLGEIAKNPDTLLLANESLKNFINENNENLPKIDTTINQKKALEFFLSDAKLNDEQKNYVKVLLSCMNNNGTLDEEKVKEYNEKDETTSKIELGNELDKKLNNITEKSTKQLQETSKRTLKKTAMKSCLTALGNYFDSTTTDTTNFADDFQLNNKKGVSFDGKTLRMEGTINGKKIGINYNTIGKDGKGEISFNSFINKVSDPPKYEIGKEGQQQTTKLEVPTLADLYEEIEDIDIADMITESKSIKTYENKLEKQLDNKIQKNFRHTELNKYYIEKNIARETAQQDILLTIENSLFQTTAEQNDKTKSLSQGGEINNLNPQKMKLISLLFKTTEKEKNPEKLQKFQNLCKDFNEIISKEKIKQGASEDLFINKYFNENAMRESNKNRKQGGDINYFTFFTLFKKGTGADEHINLQSFEKAVKNLKEGKTLEDIEKNGMTFSPEGQEIFAEINNEYADNELDNALAGLENIA